MVLTAEQSQTFLVEMATIQNLTATLFITLPAILILNPTMALTVKQFPKLLNLLMN